MAVVKKIKRWIIGSACFDCLRIGDRGSQIDLKTTFRPHQASTVERFQQLAKDGFVSPVQVQQKQEELLDLEAREGSFRRSLTAVTRDTLILKAELGRKANALVDNF